MRFAFAIGLVLAIGLTRVTLAGPPSPEQLQTWLRDLDSEDYSQRDAASRELIAAGPDAIDSLAQGVVSSSPETAWRANEALSEIAIQGDEAVLEQVAAALDRVQRNDSQGGGKAGDIVRLLRAQQARVRQERAATKLRSLGAKLSSDEQQQAMIFGGGFMGGGMVVDFGGDAFVEAMPEIVEVEEPLEEAPDKPPALRALEETIGKLADLLGGDEAVVAEAPAVEIAPPVEIPAPPVEPALELQVEETAPDPVPPAIEAPEFETQVPDTLEPPSIDVEAPVESLEGIVEIAPPELIADEVVFIGEAFVGEDAVDVEDIDASANATLTLDQQWRGGDDGLAAVRDLQNVACLLIEQAPLTDAALSHVAALPNLKQLNIQKTPFSAKALYQLRAKRPDLQIIARGEAMLGVHADFAGPCVLTGISRDSGADEAGLKAGDRIVAADGHEIVDFSDLMIAVYGHAAGETLRVEVLRNASRIASDVVLKPRSTLEN